MFRTRPAVVTGFLSEEETVTSCVVCGEERVGDGLAIRERECGAELTADDRERHLSGWRLATVELLSPPVRLPGCKGTSRPRCDPRTLAPA
jgi:hypothetical protein